ncbi:hypothetical protein BGZ75_002037, partial [Mortierella antarctica]
RTKVYYVYYRWGETEYSLDGPHETVESAKKALQVSYKDKFDVEWKEREIATNDRWTYEVKTYETFEEVEEIEEVVEETEAAVIIAREKEIVVDDHSVQIDTLTTEIKKGTVVQQTQQTVVVVDQQVKSKETVTATPEKEGVIVEATNEDIVESVAVSELAPEQKTVKEVVITREIGIAKPAVPEKSSWFRRALSGAEAAALGAGALVVGAGAVAAGVAAGAAHGAGHAASGALHKVDGVWKRTVQVLTTRKAKVDHVCPLSKTAYVYYDDEV